MIIGITSGKGGPGKSTIATNLAYYFSVNKNKKVLLIDIDWGASNTFYFFNTFPDATIYNYIKKENTWNEIKKIINPNLHLIVSGRGEIDIANISDINKANIINEVMEDEHNYDIIMFDTSPGLHRSIIDFLKISDKVAVIVNYDITALIDGYDLIKILKTENYSGEIGIIVNRMSNHKESYDKYFLIAKTSNQYFNFIPQFYGNINNSKNIQTAFANRKIFIDEFKNSETAKQIFLIGEKLYEQ